MTTHAHDPSTHLAHRADGPEPRTLATATSTRPRWLLPAIVVAIVAIGLVISGVMSPSSVLFAGLLGGMLLMHLGGHGGHGGHGGAGGHAGHDGNGNDRSADGPNPTETGVQDGREGHGCH